MHMITWDWHWVSLVFIAVFLWARFKCIALCPICGSLHNCTMNVNQYRKGRAPLVRLF